MYAILSDIHGNLYALKSVIEDMKQFNIEGVILLGDIIDYGMQSNEVVECICSRLQEKVVCNIWGNHEQAIFALDFGRFSSQRGRECAKYTASQLSEKTRIYLEKSLIHEGVFEFMIEGKKILVVHGSLEDNYWKAIKPDNVLGDYCQYNIVLSGHSHYMHMFTKFYDVDDSERRNKHAVLFINPGSVGQPRNHNPATQYALMDMKTMAVNFRAVKYDIDEAMSLYKGNVDDFYRIRLKNGV